MKYWKRMLLPVLALVLLGTGTAFAGETGPAGSRVFDMADLFDETEEADLETQIAALQETTNMGIAIVTTDDNSGSAMDFADDFYEQHEIGFGKNHDGALFLIDMENGELWISTEGGMIRYLTDSRIEAILDDAVEYAYDGSFFQASRVFLEDLETCYTNGIASDQYNYDVETGRVDRYKSIRWYEFLAAFGISLVTAGFAVLAVVREYGMRNEGARMSANFNLSYRKDSAFTVNNTLADVLLNSYVTRTVIRASHSNPGGGSGRSGGGGHSLSGGGRSSVHRSGSGRSHGGGGRKFR